MKDKLFTLVLAGSQAVLAQPNPIQIIDMSKVPLCSEIQRKVDTTLSDEQIVSRLSEYIPNLRVATFKDEAVRLFRLASETKHEECRILPQDFPLIVGRHFLLITSIAWGAGSDEFYRAIIEEKRSVGVEITPPRR